MGSIGPLQIGLFVLVLVLLFGAGRIPRLMGDMAKGIKSFKKGMKEELDDASDETNQARVDTGAKEKDRAKDA